MKITILLLFHNLLFKLQTLYTSHTCPWKYKQFGAIGEQSFGSGSTWHIVDKVGCSVSSSLHTQTHGGTHLHTHYGLHCGLFMLPLAHTQLLQFQQLQI
jgi:hypothetical protein